MVRRWPPTCWARFSVRRWSELPLLPVSSSAERRRETTAPRAVNGRADRDQLLRPTGCCFRQPVGVGQTLSATAGGKRYERTCRPHRHRFGGRVPGGGVLPGGSAGFGSGTGRVVRAEAVRDVRVGPRGSSNSSAGLG